MSKKNNNYSPITVMGIEQFEMAEKNFDLPSCTMFCRKRYFEFFDNSFISEMDLERKRKFNKEFNHKELSEKYCYRFTTGGVVGFESYKLLKSYFKGSGDLTDDYCLCTGHGGVYRFVDQPFEVVPVIPYKYVSGMVGNNPNRKVYTLGHYPTVRFRDYDDCEKKDLLKRTEEKFSLPATLNDKLIVKDYNVYNVNNSKSKVIKYRNDSFYKIEPVKWKKYGDYLVCQFSLFASPVHIKNDYTNNTEVKSFDDTFLKWYIDNVFTKDLFKYTDCTFMEEQMMKGLDEDIDSKLKEIERLKEIKTDLITRLDNKEKTNISVQENKINEADEDLKVKTKSINN